jgi:hypothetical protein
VILQGLLCVAPARALAAILLARRYPGERLLLAARAGRTPRRLRPSSVLRPRRPAAARVARGGLLIASRLAERPPPLALVTSL